MGSSRTDFVQQKMAVYRVHIYVICWRRRDYFFQYFVHFPVSLRFSAQLTKCRVLLCDLELSYTNIVNFFCFF